MARIVLSITFGITIGLLMAWLFRKEETKRAAEMAHTGLFDQTATVPSAVWVVFLMLVAVLVVGTLQIELLTGTLFSVHLPVELSPGLQTLLASLNLAPQGALLILMLLLIAPTAYLGLENVLERFNRWTYTAMGMVALTLLLAAPTFAEGSILVGITGRFVGELILIVAIGAVAARSFEQRQIAEWLWETWRFVKQIFPAHRRRLRRRHGQGGSAGGVDQSLADNTLWANFIGVVFGVFMYFPTLVEVPVARMFLDLGMHRGPLLATRWPTRSCRCKVSS